MAVRLLAVLLVLWAGPGLAQTVVVRGGEHEGFTRLVFNLPERLDYELTRSAGAARLKLARRGLTLDTRSVFERVPKTRLTEVSMPEGGDTVTLSLACACEVETFWFARAALVVDIRTPAEGSEEPEEAPGDREEPPEVPAQTVAVLDPMPQGRPSAAADLVSRGLARDLAAETGPRASPDPKTAAMLDLSRERLVREIGRAATQGLLSPRQALPEKRTPEPAATAPPPGPEAPSGPSPGANIHLRAETSIDRDMRDVMMSGLGGAQSEVCLEPALTDVASWASEAPFATQIGSFRSRLMGEFDKPNASAVTALARFYVHFGFGAEARQTLDQMGGATEAGAVLRTMAAILEQGHADAGSVLSGQMECAPMTALWSALSYRTLPANVPLDADAILRGFSALPPHLRAHLGPTLARRFLDAGLDQQSARVRRILNRNVATVTAEAALLEADVALAEGQTESAEATFDAIVDDNSAPSAEALLRLIDARLRRGTEISYDLAQLSGAYATEYRGTPLGAELSRAYLSALATSGAFDEAFAELHRVVSPEDSRRPLVRDALLGILTERAADFDFLRHALPTAAGDADRLDPATANALAGRLLALGFTAAAEVFVGPDVTGAPARPRKLLRAEIALRKALPRRAEVELLGISGEEVNLLRARARSMLGEHKAARTLFASAGDAAQARREAWLAGDWATLAAEDAGAAAAIAALKRKTEASDGTDAGEGEAAPSGATPDAAADMASGVLARNRELIEKSTEARDALRSLLAAYPGPDPVN